jgi:hypothetical protein
MFIFTEHRPTMYICILVNAEYEDDPSNRSGNSKVHNIHPSIQPYMRTMAISRDGFLSPPQYFAYVLIAWEETG